MSVHNQLYFVESIRTPSNRREGNENLYNIVLEIVTPNLGRQEQFSEFRMVSMKSYPTLNNSSKYLREGYYVYYDEEARTFASAQNNKLALARRRENNNRRKAMLSIGLSQEVERDWSEQTKVKSYHVNVGHGNCTILLLQSGFFYQIWMVDCGAIDITNGHNYYDNVQTCFHEIAKELNINIFKLTITKFFLTHWHYDHISGIQFLLRDGLINKQTIFYMNLYYAFSSKCANNLLKDLYKLKVECYEPTGNFSLIPSLKILYPECRIRRMATPYDSNYHVVQKVNDSSVVYSVSIGGRTMVLPGDLELDGWNAMTLAHTCQQRPLCCTDYFCVSHHGSDNGHVDIDCLGASHYPNVGTCLTQNIHRAIIMGRDGAYSGIYSPTVIQYWNNVIRYSEKDNMNKYCKAYVLDWFNAAESYVY